MDSLSTDVSLIQNKSIMPPCHLQSRRQPFRRSIFAIEGRTEQGGVIEGNLARLFNSSAGLTLRTLFLTTEEWNRLECLPSALLCSRENASEWLVLFSMDQQREQCRVTRWSILKECITPRPQGVIWEVPWKEANLKITGSYSS